MLAFSDAAPVRRPGNRRHRRRECGGITQRPGDGAERSGSGERIGQNLDTREFGNLVDGMAGALPEASRIVLPGYFPRAGRAACASAVRTICPFATRFGGVVLGLGEKKARGGGLSDAVEVAVEADARNRQSGPKKG
jgi:hypothetical protein